MPNHVTTRCFVHGTAEAIAAFAAAHIVKDRDEPESGTDATLDFRTIIPMPRILSETQDGTEAEFGMELITLRASRQAPFQDRVSTFATWFAKFRTENDMANVAVHQVAEAWLKKEPRYEAAGRLRMQAIIETGYSSWYPWSIAHWGTKWNAYDVDWSKASDEAPLELVFNTAWSFPQLIFEKLVELHPDLAFECYTFDEGHNFAGQGWFGVNTGAGARDPFALCDANDAIYERVYGHPPEKEEEEAAEETSA